jgi:hypothetical protein
MTAAMFRRFFSDAPNDVLAWLGHVRDEMRAFVDDWWAETFGCADADLWQ